MSTIFKSLKLDIRNHNSKTQVLHIPNDKNHIITNHQKITWLGLKSVVQCSCINCVVNKDN